MNGNGQHQTNLALVVNRYQQSTGLRFKPEPTFYQRIGINPKRFGQLLRGEKTLNVNEAKSLSDFFKVPVTDLF